MDTCNPWSTTCTTEMVLYHLGKIGSPFSSIPVQPVIKPNPTNEN
eukprot:04626.XXX_68433_68567_1 [CDS] Oithona nana genome sequencing.